MIKEGLNPIFDMSEISVMGIFEVILKINKIITVEIDKFIVLLKVKKVEATIAGTINKIEKGFVIPPVKYNKKDN